MKLQGRVALVTGGGRGIGRAIAQALAREGAKVAVAARSREQVEETAGLLGRAALGIVADVRRPDDVRRMAEQAVAGLGPIDLLVNNAGVARFAPILQATVADWQAMFDVNVLGALLCTQAVLPSMLERRRGWIINIASSSSVKGYVDQSGYCASKHALLGFAKVLALETRDAGIRVHCICPGGVDTEMAGQNPSFESRADLMRPEEIAELVVFLASLDGVMMIDNVVVRRYKATPWS
ncbi:MAG TPA: SDR family oxidoreductase [Planctomycetota bacterium]|nr:SDR family oxidoreductase [Planctomycetota bacterium]HRR79707.1 SDR family oxidoreductase [Planctomycetota bacterium]HRT97237.1 SDR family oxidoreductase [Planctomycetota bacterium]